MWKLTLKKSVNNPRGYLALFLEQWSCQLKNTIFETRLKINDKIVEDLGSNSYILTCGCGAIWERIGKKLHMHVLHGAQMSAETKYYIAKFLHAAGKRVRAFGDSMSDYYMLKEADEGFLVLKSDGTISRSLKNRNLEGLQLVRIGENG